MKINIQLPASSTRTRILAAFMAFLILALTFEQAFVGWEVGTRVKAYPEAGNGIVTSKPSYSKYMGQNHYTTSHDSAGNDNGAYTGKILPVTVSMYDYLTDAEIDSNHNTTWNNINDSRYTFWSRYNPYDKFNTVISNANTSTATTIVSPASDNITIIYDPDSTASPSDYLYVYLFIQKF